MNFIATNVTDATQFGMKSDTGIQLGVTGSGIQHRLPFAASGGGWSDFISGTAFPPPSSANFSYGTLDFTQTNLLFQFLKTDKCSKIVQAPKILALDNQEATIFVGESIRYARSTAASNQNGGLTFSVEEDENSPVNVGFQLLVIPHVIPGENKIQLPRDPAAALAQRHDEPDPRLRPLHRVGPDDRSPARRLEHDGHADDPARQGDGGHRRSARGPRPSTSRTRSRASATCRSSACSSAGRRSRRSSRTS